MRPSTIGTIIPPTKDAALVTPAAVPARAGGNSSTIIVNGVIMPPTSRPVATAAAAAPRAPGGGGPTAKTRQASALAAWLTRKTGLRRPSRSERKPATGQD